MVFIVKGKIYKNIQGGTMNMDEYFKKIYTIAFRLTGDKKTACKLSAHAILEVSGEIDINSEISEGIIKSSALGVCALFLKSHNELCSENDFTDRSLEIQDAVLGLEPESRIIIVWKDLLGYQLSDLIQVTSKSIKELTGELSQARMQVKKSLEVNMLQSSP